MAFLNCSGDLEGRERIRADGNRFRAPASSPRSSPGREIIRRFPKCCDGNLLSHLTEDDGAKFKEAKMTGGNNHALTGRRGCLKMLDAFVFAAQGECLCVGQSSDGDIVRNGRAKIYEN